MSETNIVVDHVDWIIFNVPIMEIGLDTCAGSITRDIAQAYATAISNSGPGHASQRSMLETFASQFLDADRTPHLVGAQCPVLRLGRPDNAEYPLVLDIAESRGLVIGEVKSARFRGKVLLANLHLASMAPIIDWPCVRDSLLALARSDPEKMGILPCHQQSPLLPIACDLVAAPVAGNKYGLFGNSRAGCTVDSIGHPRASVFADAMVGSFLLDRDGGTAAWETTPELVDADDGLEGESRHTADPAMLRTVRGPFEVMLKWPRRL